MRRSLFIFFLLVATHATNTMGMRRVWQFLGWNDEKTELEQEVLRLSQIDLDTKTRIENTWDGGSKDLNTTNIDSEIRLYPESMTKEKNRDFHVYPEEEKLIDEYEIVVNHFRAPERRSKMRNPMLITICGAPQDSSLKKKFIVDRTVDFTHQPKNSDEETEKEKELEDSDIGGPNDPCTENIDPKVPDDWKSRKNSSFYFTEKQQKKNAPQENAWKKKKNWLQDINKKN